MLEIERGRSPLFGRESRAEKLTLEGRGNSLVPLATLAAIYGGARPVAERLLYDDDLRDNIRTFIDSARKIYDEVSGEDLDDIVAKLWDDDKLRSQVEAAAEAVQQGSKRVRGERIRGGGGGFGTLLLILAAALGFLFLYPKTGPQARSIAKDIIGNLRS
jgi:hypothetical protein